MTDRVCSAAADAERSLVGSAILDPSVIDAAVEIVVGSQFADLALGRVFDHMADLRAARIPIGDTTVLVSELRRAGLIEGIGGVAGVGCLTNASGSPSSATYHASEVQRLHRIRSLRELAAVITDTTSDPSADPSETVARVESHLRSSDAHREGVYSLSDIVLGLADQMTLNSERGEVVGVGTGISSVDLMTGGILPGELVVVGARTSIGKTAFGMQIAMDAAEQGHAVMVVSLEMDQLQLAHRVAAAQLSISLIDLRTGNYGAPEIDLVRKYAIDAIELPYTVFPARRATMARIRGIARSRKSTDGLSLLVVDYLQLIAATDPRRPRYEQVTQISHDLKTLAMELEVPVIALAQLNRQGESDDTPPKLSHLRESGAIEQDADSVWFLHRARNANDTRLIIEKQRQGKRGTLDLTFDGNRCRFNEQQIEDYPNFESRFTEGVIQ